EGGEEETKKDEKAKTVPFYKLFAFADSYDVLLMICGSVGAMGNGVGLPLMTLLFGDLIDSFGQNQNNKDIVDVISKVCVKFVYLGLGTLGAAFLQVACWMITGERQAAARIRNMYLKTILRQDIGFFDVETNTGEVVGRMSGDTVFIQDAMGEKVGMAGAAMAIIVTRASSQGQAAYAKAATVVEQTIGSIRTVASFTREKEAINKYKKFITSAYKSSIQQGFSTGLGLGIMLFVLFSSYALAIWFGGKMILEKGYTGGAVINVLIIVVAGAMSSTTLEVLRPRQDIKSWVDVVWSKGAIPKLKSRETTSCIDFLLSTVMTYMPQDFRGTLIRQQKERSERNRQAEVDALVSSGGTIRDTYALLWKHQMERRRQLAQLGSATGVYKTLVKYLVGVPQVLLDFIRQINDDDGPMEEQRERYGPHLYNLTKMVTAIRVSLTLLWERYDTFKLNKNQMNLLSEAVIVYTSEFERFITFISDVFANSPFFISADTAGTLGSRENEEYKEIIVQAGRTYEVLLMVESENSYIAWDFSLVQGKISMVLLFEPQFVSPLYNLKSFDCFSCLVLLPSSEFCLIIIGMSRILDFCVEYISASGEKTLILPYHRYEADQDQLCLFLQGNFSTLMAGNYKLVWDNSYSSFFRKVE
ncbi:hypothetical protein DY000_02000005, partial [Brassica cretica]